MTDADLESLDRRLRAVERTLTDEPVTSDALDHGDSASDLEERIADLESEVADLQAAVQALRGYVGNVRSVNRSVERRAERALAAVEDLDADAIGRQRTRTRADTASKAYGGESEAHDGDVDGRREDPSNARRPGATRTTGRDDGSRVAGDAPTHGDDGPGTVDTPADGVSGSGDVGIGRNNERTDGDEGTPSLDLPPGRGRAAETGTAVGGRSLDVDDPVDHEESPFDEGPESDGDGALRSEHADDGTASAGLLERVRNVL